MTVEEERARCAAIVKRWFGDGLWDIGYECVREIMTGLPVETLSERDEQAGEVPRTGTPYP